MLDKLLMLLWVKHPRMKEPDAMLTLSVLTTLACLTKFMLNDVTFTFLGHAVDCGHVDSLAYTALLTPTLGAYAARKWKDRPEPKLKTEENT